MRSIIVIFCLVLGSLAACRPVPPPPAPAPVDHYVRAPFDTVWARVIEFFADNQISIETIDKASGILVSRPFQVPRQSMASWAQCETHSMGTPMIQHPGLRIVADFNVLVRSRGDSTAVRVNTAMQGRVNTVGVECNTSGMFERLLYGRIGAN